MNPSISSTVRFMEANAPTGNLRQIAMSPAELARLRAAGLVVVPEHHEPVKRPAIAPNPKLRAAYEAYCAIPKPEKSTVRARSVQFGCGAITLWQKIRKARDRSSVVQRARYAADLGGLRARGLLEAGA